MNFLNPCVLFNIAFVGFTFIPFATILLIFTYAFHVVFIVIAPEVFAAVDAGKTFEVSANSNVLFHCTFFTDSPHALHVKNTILS